MRVKLAIAAATLGMLAVGWTTQAGAQRASERGAGPSAHSAYAQANPKRARTRIRVRPRCFYRREALDYPTPYECEAPGPGYVRECAAQLVQEYRPSGTVIVPVTRCWWQPG
jgi:hypothetical protein